MSGEDVARWAELSIETNNNVMPGGVSSDPNLFSKNLKELVQIAAKYNIKEVEIGKAIEETKVYDKIQGAKNKYDEAKDVYLTDNAKTKEKESFGDSYLTIVQPIYAKDGVTVIGYKDPSNDKGMKAASDDVTKQIQDQFTKGIGVNDIFSTIQSEGEGTFKSIADIKTEEAEKLGEDKDPNNIIVGIPYYSNIPDGNGNRQMYVNVGTQIVPINMKTLRVNYGGGQVPLDQLNNTPEAKTTNWIGTTYSSGVKNYPTTDNSGNNIVISMPGKMNQGSSGSFANNTDLQVTYYDKNGTPLESYNGINAFNIINTLNQQGKLK